MKRIVLFLLFTLLMHPLFSQEETITLKDCKVDLPNFRFYIDSIVDARNEKICIGAIQKDQDNIKPLFFENDFKTEMNYLFAPYMVKDPTKKPLILKVNRLFISNYKRTNDYFTVAEMNISFLTKKNSSYYEYLSIGKYSKSSGNKGKNVAKLSTQIMLDFLQRYSTVSPVAVPDSTLSENNINDRHFIISDTKTFVKGIFWTMEDFLNFKTDTATQFKYHVVYNNDDRDDALSANMGLIESNKVISDLWGFSDGKNIFARIGHDFYPVEIKDNEIYMTIMQQNKPTTTYLAVDISDPVVSIVVDFCAILLINSLSDQGKSLSANTYYLDLASSLFKSKYDLSNGAAEAYSLFYCPDTWKSEKPIKLIYKDSMLCSLLPMNYYILKTPSDVKQFDIILQYDTVQHSYTIEPGLFSLHAYSIKPRNDTKINFSQQYYDVKESVLDKIEKKIYTNPCKSN